ncbi:MAG: NlpC/P60 family protein [Geminicoccaceae bacterium]|nr:NlpC/P60 family protein [Geminicoccaceae bacterium]
MDARDFAYRLISAAVPFKEHGRGWDGLDCWGLVWLGYREVLGIDLPSYAEEYDTTRGRLEDGSPNRKLSDLIVGKRDLSWVRVYDLQPMNVALFRYASAPLHVGLVIDARDMVHVERGAEVAVEPHAGPAWGPRLLGYWRPA